MKNAFAPINRIPPEVLTLIPDYCWWHRDNGPIAVILTHVCRAWREIFSSHSSLWTEFDCLNADKTRVYLERSKSSPINLWILRKNGLSPNDPLLQVIPHATSRLKYLYVSAMPENVGDITIHLSHPAPLLEDLSIDCADGPGAPSNFVLPPSLFNGDLSSLHTLSLGSVRTNVPWRNMVNLTSFCLRHIPPGDISIGQLLDFFESAPRLKNVDLECATPVSGAQRGRFVQLKCLKWMGIQGAEPCSLLLDHLLIPVGAKVEIRTYSPGSRLEAHLPRSLRNFRNLSNLNKISLTLDVHLVMKFTGPHGKLSLDCPEPPDSTTSQVFEYLARIDTSRIEQLEVFGGNPPSRDLPHQVLLRMKNLRILALYQCRGLHLFIRALHPDVNSSEVVVCPDLGELILAPLTNGRVFDINDLVSMATARASVWANLGNVRIICRQDEVDLGDLLELRKHVPDVECGLMEFDSEGSEEG